MVAPSVVRGVHVVGVQVVGIAVLAAVAVLPRDPRP
jgi:hypothetical protein